MRQRICVVLEEDGSFPCENEKVLFVNVNQEVLFVLHSPLLKTHRPLLLIQRARPGNKDDFLDFQPNGSYPYDTVLEQHLVETGSFNKAGLWEFTYTFKAPGSQLLQVVFIEDTPLEKGKNIKIKEIGREEYFIVEPIVKLNGKPTNPREMRMMTLITRCMGDITRWPKLIQNLADRGYNCFHLTPLQQPGDSNSLYSIKDQLTFAPSYFPGKQDPNEQIALMKKTLQDLRETHHVLFLTDVVLNHTSVNSEWVLQYPDALYTTKNTPHLMSAYVLDDAIAKFNQRLVKKEDPKYPNGNRISSEDDVKLVIKILREDIIPSLGLPTYYQYDIKARVAEIREYLAKTKSGITIDEIDQQLNIDDEYNIFKKDKVEQMCEIFNEISENVGYETFGVKIDLPRFISFLEKRFDKSSVSYATIEKAFERLNIRNNITISKYLEEAVQSIHDDVLYYKVNCHRHELNLADNRLVQPYFVVLKNGLVAAHNGWLTRGDPTENFAISKSYAYLRRHIVIWTDLLKLRYGETKEEQFCGPVWDRMTKYVQMTASMFDGMRIDNAHSTPIQVAEYLLDKARQVNPNTFAFAELFTMSAATDAKYIKRLGINGLVREAIRPNNAQELSGFLHFYSSALDCASGSLNKYYVEYCDERRHFMRAEIPRPICYDLTHDNEPYSTKRTFMDILPTMALLCFSNSLVATTKGMDELYEKNPSIIDEFRLYPTEVNDTVKRPQKQKVYFFVEAKEPVKEHVEMEKHNAYANGFMVNLEMSPGEYEYKFIIDGVWTGHTARTITPTGNNLVKVEDKTMPKIYENCIEQRKKFNNYHKLLSEEFPFFFLHNEKNETNIIVREHKTLRESYVLIARSAFSHTAQSGEQVCNDVVLPGYISEVCGIYWMKNGVNEKPNDQKFLYGIKTDVIEEHDLGNFCTINTE